MNDDKFIITEEYPSGHEMSTNEYGPATEAEFRAGMVPPDSQYAPSWTSMLEIMRSYSVGPGGWSVEDRLNDLFQDGVLYMEEGCTLRLQRIRDLVVVTDYFTGDTEYNGPYSMSEATVRRDYQVQKYPSPDAVVRIFIMTRPQN